MALSSAVRQCILRHVEWDKNLEPAVTKNFLQRMSTMGAHEMYDNFLTLLPVRYQSRCNAVIAAPRTLCVCTTVLPRRRPSVGSWTCA